MDRKHNELSSGRKAEAALQVLRGCPVDEVSKRIGVPSKKVMEWVAHIEQNAARLLNPDEETQALQHKMDLFQNVQKVVPSGLMLTNLEGEIIDFNRQCIEMWDVPRDIAESSDIYQAMNYVEKQLTDPESFRKTVQKMYAKPEIVIKDQFSFRDGRHFQRHSIPDRRGNRIVGRITSFLNITEYMEAREKASHYGSMVNSISKNVNEGILRSTPEEGLMYVNDAFVSMFGYDSEEEVLQTDPEKFYCDKNRRGELVKRLQKEKKLVNEEVKFRRKDGSYFWGLENSTLIESEGQIYIDAVVNDISERKKTEQALRDSEEKYKTILRSIEEGYFETDLAGNFTFFNRALQQMIGYTPKELEGMNNREYMDEENARKVYDVFNRVYRTEQPEQGFDWELIRRDGKRIYVEVSVNLRRDTEGNVIGFRGIARNVTERKQKEQQIKESLKEKEVLLGEIHHRVKNNLAVISGLLFLQAENAEDNVAQELLKQSQSRINSMASVHEMLYENQTFSSIEPGQYIKRLIDHIRKNFESDEKDIDIRVETKATRLDMNVAIPCALIINELITNAYKYAFEGRKNGVIKVGLHEENGQFRLVVEDNGIGMDTTMPDHESEGLGLYLVDTFTRQLEGELSMDSKEGKGTRFEVDFSSENNTN